MVRRCGGLKGKVNWFSMDQLISKKLLSSDTDLIDPTDDELEDLKEKCIMVLRREGFVFFPYSAYRVVLGRKGKIKEFGVQFHYIE